MTIHILYPKFTRIDKGNNNVPFSGVPSTLFTHRTIDKHPEHTYVIHPYETAEATFLPLPGDRILCLGEDWLERLFGHRNINKVRGYRLYYRGIPVIVTYTHMDCWDAWGDLEEGGKEQADKGNDKDAAPTKRANYLFWVLSDFEKLLRDPRPHPKPITRIKPSMAYVVKWIDGIPSEALVSLDIETRPHDNCLDCIGIGRKINATAIETLVVPQYHYTDKLAYTLKETAQFWRALYKLLLRTDITIVGQNIAFDIAVLHHYYKLPLPDRVFDTMLFMHRHYPLADKSLSHVISYYTDAMENHKGEFCPNLSQATETQLFAYNGKDVYWTLEAANRQIELMATMPPPFARAISDAMEAQRTTMLMSFTGMHVDVAALNKRKSELEYKAAAWTRIIRKLTGIHDFNPSSSKQCADYFYKELGYDIPAFTESGAPQMDEKALYDIQLKQDNPLFPLIIAARGAEKEISTLNFKPYKKHISAL